MKGGIGEKALRQIIENAHKVADRCLPNDSYRIRKNADDLTAMANALCELRAASKGTSPQAESLAREMIEKLGDLEQNILHAVINVDKAGLQQAAHTVS